MPIRVAIADDQPLIRSGLTAFIMAAEGLVLVGEAVNGEEAIQLCELVQPDILVMDLKMPVMDGITATRTIRARWPNIQVLILTTFLEKGMAQSALDAGAIGYFIKDITAEELTTAIHKAYHERRPVTPRELSSQETSLEYIRQALSEEDIDASRLASLLRRHLPAALPECEMEVRLLPVRELLKYPAESIHRLSENGWRWLQAQTEIQVMYAGDPLPWGPEPPCACDLLLAPVLDEAGKAVGGLAVWSANASDEINHLQWAVKNLTELLSRPLSQMVAAARQPGSQNLAQQLAAAAKIQTDLLPLRMPVLPGWDLAARLEPALETSGDFYDLIPLLNNHWGLVIADVSDKGMGAALFMALTSTLIRTYAKQYPTLPALSISTVNERILSDSRSGMFVTAFYAVLDPLTGRIRYVNAGHNPPILISSQKSKSLDRLQSTGMALGVMGDLIWKQKVVRLLPGDTLVMYTDGVTDAQDQRGQFYGEQRLLNVIRHCACPAQETLEAILQDVRSFTGGMPQADDITLLVVRREN